MRRTVNQLIEGLQDGNRGARLQQVRKLMCRAFMNSISGFKLGYDDSRGCCCASQLKTLSVAHLATLMQPRQDKSTHHEEAQARHQMA